jgi:hypothetical protein
VHLLEAQFISVTLDNTNGVRDLRLSPRINPLNTKLNPICHLLTLLGAHHILHVSRIRVKQDLLSFWFLRTAEWFITDRLSRNVGKNHSALLEIPDERISQ